MKPVALALTLAVPALRPAVPAIPALPAPLEAPSAARPSPLVPLSHPSALPAWPQAAGLPPLSWSYAPRERVPVYYRAAFARALEAHAAVVRDAAPQAAELRLRSFAEHEHAWEVEAVVRRAGAEAERLRVFLGKHDGRLVVVPAE